MPQFFTKVAWPCLILFCLNIYADERFLSQNKVLNGLAPSSNESIFEQDYIVPQSQLIGIDQNLFPIQDPMYQWQEIFKKSKCTDYQFEQSFNYIKFLFNLSRVTINYEILLDLRENTKNLGLHRCNVDFSQLNDSCRPKSSDMKKFLSRLRGYFASKSKNELSNYNKIQNFNIKSLTSIPEVDIFSPLMLSLKKSCAESNKCSNKGDYISQVISKKCDLRKAEYVDACSENDSMFHQIVSKEMVNLIKRSSAINYINKFGAGSECVERFFEEYVEKRWLSSDIRKDDFVIRSVMRSVVKLNIPYLQGRLFVLGSLKEFDELGVGNDIFKEIKVAEKKIELPEIKTIKKMIKKTPKSTRKVIKSAILIEKKPKVTVKRASALHQAAKEIISSGEKVIALDMEHFKKDYIFSNEVLTKLHGPLLNFQKRDSLGEMKKFDQLGEKKAPMPLLFIKYLIDNDYHQGLYNIQAVLGSDFYIKNDLEKGDSNLYRVGIKNDESTNYVWQLYLIKN